MTTRTAKATYLYSDWPYMGTERLACTVETDKAVTTRLACDASLSYALDNRIAHDALPAATIHDLFAGDATLSYVLSDRVAEIAELDAPATDLLACLTAFNESHTDTLAEVAELDASSYEVSAGTADLSYVILARYAQLALPEATVQPRLAQVCNVESSVANVIAETSRLEALVERREAQLSSLRATVTVRLSQLANLDKNVTVRFAERSSLDAPGTSRTAGVASLTYYDTPQLAQLSILEASVTPRFNQLASLDEPWQIAFAQACSLWTETPAIIYTVNDVDNQSGAPTVTMLPDEAITITGAFLDSITGIHFEPYGPDSSPPTSSPSGPMTPTLPITYPNFATVDNNTIVIPSSIVNTLRNDGDLLQDVWYKPVLVGSSTYQPQYLQAGTASLTLEGHNARLAGDSAISITLTEKASGIAELQLATAIPRSQYSVAHVGFRGTTPISYAGPTWDAGPDNANITAVASAALFGGTVKAPGVTNWSNRRYYRITPYVNPISTAYATQNFMATFIFCMPASDGDWGNAPFMFGMGRYNLISTPAFNVYASPGYASTKATTLGFNTGSGALPLSSASIDTNVNRVVTVAHSGNNIYIKQNNANVTTTTTSTVLWSSAVNNNTYIGTSSYTPDTNPSSTSTSGTWSNGIIYEIRICTFPSTITTAQIDALHAAIMA